MKWINILTAVLLTASIAACQSPNDNAEVEGAPDNTQANALPQQQREAAMTAITNRVNDIQQDISSLQSSVATAPEDVRDDVQDALQKAQEEMQDIDTLKANLSQTNGPDDWYDTREKVWEEIEDADYLVSKARFQAANSLEDFKQVGQDELQKLDSRIQDLDTEGATLSGNDRQAWDDQMNELQQARDDYNQTWNQLEQATEDNWQDLKGNVIDEWHDLEEAFYSVRLEADENNGIATDSTGLGIAS